jgi:predicted enzyme related to lactoylglutathione lyase
MNSVIHFELPAEDMARAEKFYQDVFGWEMNRMMDEYYTATTIESDENGPKKPGGINGALAKKSDQYQSTDIVIDVPNLEEHLEKVKAHGGQVLRDPQEVFDMGRFAMFRDTEGNTVGLWQGSKGDKKAEQES